MPKSDSIEEASFGAAAQPVDFRKWLQLFVEKWWFIVPATVGLGLLGAYFASTIPLNYSAKAVIQVEQEEQKLISIEEVTKQDLRASEVLNTFASNIKNSSVLLRVAKGNDLMADPSFLARKTNDLLTEAQAMRALQSMITCKLRKDTRLIDIIVEHRQAEMAQKLANSVAYEFIRQNLDQRFSTTTAANELLYKQAGKLKLKLENSEKDLQAYKEQKQTVALEDRQNITMDKLRGLNQKYTEAKAVRLQVEADWRQIQQLSRQPEALLSLPSVLLDPAVAETRKRYIEQETKVKSLTLRYKPKYPKMIQAQRELQDLREALEQLAAKSPLSAQAAYEGALAREQTLESALKEAQKEVLELDQKGIQYNVLLREVESNRALYQSVLKRLKETDFTKGLEKHSIAVVEPAGLPSAPNKPAKAILSAIGALVGLVGSAGLMFLVQLTDSSIRTVDEAEQVLGLPVLAAITRAKRKRKGLRHVVVEEPDSTCAEAFRSLRTSAHLLGDGKKVQLFTSAIPNEGKTFCSLNHAHCQGQEGQRTLLIDLDLRRPSIGASFSLPPKTPGVTDYLLGAGSLEPLIQATPYPNLFLLSSGPKIAHPAEQLSKEAVKRLITEASERYDRVIIDTAPLNAVSDTFLLLPLAQLVFLIVRAGKTPRRAILRALELMARSSPMPAGMVLNFLPRQAGHGYYYYYSQDDGYRSKEVYGAGVPKEAARS